MKSARWKFLAPAPLLAGLLCGLALAQTDDQAIQERLAKHAKLFEVGRANWSRLENLKPNPQGIIVFDNLATATYMAFSPPLTPEQELTQLSASVDAVISGTTVQQYSAFNSFHTMLYSDWIINVTKVYKNNSTITAQPGAQITVTRRGGDLIYNGTRIIAKDRIFPDFAVNREYVFYLKALPDSSSFQAMSGGTFDVTGATPLLLAAPTNPTSMREGFSSLRKADFAAVVERSARR